MHDFVVEVGTEGFAGLLGSEALDALGVGCGVVRQSAGELLALCVADADDVSLVELSDDVDDADCEQAIASGFESALRGRSSACGRGGFGRQRGTMCPPVHRPGFW